MGSREEFPKISIENLDDWNQVAANCKRAAADVARSEGDEAGLSSAERDLILKHMEKVGVFDMRLYQ